MSTNLFWIKLWITLAYVILPTLGQTTSLPITVKLPTYLYKSDNTVPFILAEVVLTDEGLTPNDGTKVSNEPNQSANDHPQKEQKTEDSGDGKPGEIEGTSSSRLSEIRDRIGAIGTNSHLKHRKLIDKVDAPNQPDRKDTGDKVDKGSNDNKDAGGGNSTNTQTKSADISSNSEVIGHTAVKAEVTQDSKNQEGEDNQQNMSVGGIR